MTSFAGGRQAPTIHPDLRVALDRIGFANADARDEPHSGAARGLGNCCRGMRLVARGDSKKGLDLFDAGFQTLLRSGYIVEGS